MESARIATFGGGGDRHRKEASPALERARAIPLVREEMLAGRQQERAKPAAALVGAAEAALLDEPGEEALGQVLRLVGRVTLAPHEREDGIPVQEG